MSSKNKLKYIYTYLSLLEISSSDLISKWNIKHIDRAFKYSEYCEEVNYL